MEGGCGGVNALRRVTAAAFLITLFISPKLWLTTRDYPLTPIWSRLPQPPYPLDYVLFWGMAGALLAAALLPDPRGVLKIVCIIALLWAILDQSRWQPYFLIYMAFLACLFALPFERRGTWSAAEIKWALLPARLLIVFAYLYSGLQKLNHEFVTKISPWMMGPLQRMIHFDVMRLSGGWVTAMALSAAAGEAAGGVLLLFPKTRRPAALFLAAMHGFVLLMIGPLGYKWNQVIWPWNIVMIVALWALFWKQEGDPWPTPRLMCPAWWRTARARSPIMVPTMAFLFGIMPLLSFWGRWDSYLSFSLYSGSLCKRDIQIDPEDYNRMPSAAQAATDPDSGFVDQIEWSIAEMGAMPYPEPRIALSIGRALARRARHGAVRVQISGKPNMLTGQRKKQYFACPPGGAPAYEIAYDEFSASP